MDKYIYKQLVEILKEELVPAMGCTEPIALAYCAALAQDKLNCTPSRININVSANIIKNVKSVVVPNTGGKRGIASACAAGIIASYPDKNLEVLSTINEENIKDIDYLLENSVFKISKSDNDHIFYIEVELEGEGHVARAKIAGNHTNVIHLSYDDEIFIDRDYKEEVNKKNTDRSVLSIKNIVQFADCVNVDDVKDVLQRQIDYNLAIANEGLRGDYGANIGRILLKSYGNSVYNRAKAYAAAGSDGRMNGCELPVVINSGSGNQGLTASLPVIIYAKDMNASQDLLYRALVVSNLVTIHLKEGIGCLSAYCGATSAGCGAGTGICYLYGGKYDEIAHTLVNALAINSGMVCDGAKASCAAKIASAVESGLLGLKMQMNDSQFYGGDGIVKKGVENTINNVSTLASIGMKETDQTIIKIMTEE